MPKLWTLFDWLRMTQCSKYREVLHHKPVKYREIQRFDLVVLRKLRVSVGHRNCALKSIGLCNIDEYSALADGAEPHRLTLTR